MAVAMTGSADDKDAGDPVFHDFLGMSCGDAPPSVWAKGGIGVGSGSGSGRVLEMAEGSVSVSASAASPGASSGGHGLVSGSSDLGSGLEVNNQLLGRKRSKSDSAFMGLLRERVLPIVSDSPESSHTLKVQRKEVMSGRARRSHDDVAFTTQPPPRPTSSVIVHPPVAGRPDSMAAKWERSTPLNSGSTMHCTSHFGQSAIYVDKLSSAAYNDCRASAPLISPGAADEGSRTGIKGGGILNVINSGCGSGERKSAGTLPSNNKMTPISQITEPESSSILSSSRHGISTTSRQMTIFYAGQAHVFDDVHPKKADIIMALAGSDGGSWSTVYSAKSPVHPPGSDVKPSGVEKEAVISNLPFPQGLNSRLSIPGNSGHGGFGHVPRIPLLGDSNNLTSVGRAAREVRPTKTVEADTERKGHIW
uniref:Protein TIFY n=1 Tax=Anthurium amnicola TaxID=1678845 RepID=A0A1D1Y3N8_9ARAE